MNTKEEQNQELQKLLQAFKSPKSSFDLIKKTTRVGNLYHRFVSLKMEGEQNDFIRNNEKSLLDYRKKV